MTLVGRNTFSIIKRDYYLDERVLIYVLEKEYEFREPVTLETPFETVYPVFKTENFFKIDHLIRQLDGQDGGHPFSSEYLLAAGESILEDFRTLLIAAKTMD